ncbi:MAG: hypothetical protein OXU34_06870, partial [Gammaproteobacteria bacterium]|nr:hypothetical protein [Gammaproteobacteria bacterium]
NRRNTMRDIVIPDFVVYITMVVTIVAVLITIYADRITDWLMAREERKKKAAAEAEAKSG